LFELLFSDAEGWKTAILDLSDIISKLEIEIALATSADSKHLPLITASRPDWKDQDGSGKVVQVFGL